MINEFFQILTAGIIVLILMLGVGLFIAIPIVIVLWMIRWVLS